MTTTAEPSNFIGPAPTGAVLGGVTEARNRVTSVTEEKAREVLREAGYRVPKQKMAVWCRHPDKPGRLLPLTPDIVLIGKRLAIEVDPCGQVTSHHGSSHRGKEADDRLRNHLLEEVGWTVLRLRLGADEGMNIGDRDVVCESASLTVDAAQALLAAVEDAVALRKPLLRFVPKKATAAPRKPAVHRSSIFRLGDFKYGDQAHIFSWLPDLNSDHKIHLRLAFDGRFLYTHSKPPRFLAEVGLNDIPRREWKPRLQELLPTLPDVKDVGQAKYPWGETLLIAASAQPDALAVVQQCEWKCDIDRADYYFTANCDRLVTATEQSLLDGTGAPVVALHPAAAALGYRFVLLEQLRGFGGPYQRITLTRRDAWV